ncbi:P-loop containing nucleoside triphosphate hydrolase protein [Obba rivulosa]|uniref:P-loop containing nucleoside triphosphate hydrolase protein n=1 Tax=Obba rivulosa TaxID=1052685 RepID=A0A8E2AT06_9APHY|nr:P-loop containing nucleoside triphosphate hydrolase protein [Obba rivulosa]
MRTNWAGSLLRLSDFYCNDDYIPCASMSHDECTRDEDSKTVNKDRLCHEQVVHVGQGAKLRMRSPLATTVSRGDTPCDDDILVAVMGQSGAGKSTFINLLSGSSFAVGHDLDSSTMEVRLSRPFELDGRRVRLVDTPGFDDSSKSDAEILTQIADFLVSPSQRCAGLNGVLYLHRISDVRVGGAARRNITMFHQLCGPEYMTNVVIATTRWQEVDEETGSRREEELRTSPTLFNSALDSGALLVRHDRDLESAQDLMRHFLHLSPKPLLIQKEMIDDHKLLSDTSAGAELERDILLQLQKQKKDIDEMMREQEDAVKEQDEELNADLEEEMQSLRATHARLQAQFQRLAEHRGLPMESAAGSPGGSTLEMLVVPDIGASYTTTSETVQPIFPPVAQITTVSSGILDPYTSASLVDASAFTAPSNALSLPYPVVLPAAVSQAVSPVPSPSSSEPHVDLVRDHGDVLSRLSDLERSVEGVKNVLKGLDGRVQHVEDHLLSQQLTSSGSGEQSTWTGWLYEKTGQLSSSISRRIEGIVPGLFKSDQNWPSVVPINTEDYVMLDRSDIV